MEARDTVITDREIIIKLMEKFYGFDPQMDFNEETTKIIKEAQAEISFKMGYNQAESEFELKFNPDYLNFQKGVAKGKIIGRQTGIKEVVDWIPELMQEIKKSMRKDDWGIKGVIYEDMLDSLVRKQIKVKVKEWGL